ncbi:MAG: hypothetical protein J6S85_01140 [Methanobrevibacter sp.]|nr:hypothetical protein [Methanobrevibacter sp.]MBO7712137.1 hypothetical protein [Methanobrevibacter sp.]
MKELKDIVLKKNDIVYYDDDYLIVDGLDGKTANEVEGSVSKIERPIKYETIYETPKEILDKEEKEYLEHFLRPFKDKVYRIEKEGGGFYSEGESIRISVRESSDIILPTFRKDTMYKGMELDKEYTLKELGLFKE